MKAVSSYEPTQSFHLQGKWAGYSQAAARKNNIDTGFDADKLKEIALASVTLPVKNASLHQRLERSHIDARIQSIQAGEPLDWATVEAMAFGSLLVEKFAFKFECSHS